MKKALGIVNLHSNPSLDKLTENRPLGVVTFLGRYGLIDLSLSNFTNSDINKIEVLVEYGLDSVRSHIQNGTAWISNTKTGYLRSVINEHQFGDKKHNTDVANIIQNIPYDVFDEDYIVVASPQYLMNLDYRDVLRKHGESNADITIVYAHTSKVKDFVGADFLKVEKDGRITKFLDKITAKTADVSVESYVFSKDAFFKMLEFSKEISNTKTTIRNIVELFTNNKVVKVCGYKLQNEVFPILSLNQYVEQSFKMLDQKYWDLLFPREWPIYTTTHNTPPTLYGEKADISNSIIANGAIVNGKVKNSILSRDVLVDEGASIVDCILFSRTEIGENVHLSRVLTDKNVKIKTVKKLSGDNKNYLLIAKGAKI